MNFILENLYIGDEQDSKDFWITQEPLYTTFDLRGWNIDEKGMTPGTAYFLEKLCENIDIARSLGPVLVHCHAGMDRAPFVVAVYFVLEHGFTPNDAYKFVKSRRPQTIVHDDWMFNFIRVSNDHKEGEKTE